MAGEARLRYPTFQLRADPQGVVHLDPVKLPEVIAMGIDAWVEFRKEIWPLGGAHATIPGKGRLHVVTPEAEFEYETLRIEKDTAGWYLVMRLTYTDATYRAFIDGQ